MRVHWIVARDWPIPTKDESWTEARIISMRQQFLQLHDKKTAGNTYIYIYIHAYIHT